MCLIPWQCIVLNFTCLGTASDINQTKEDTGAAAEPSIKKRKIYWEKKSSRIHLMLDRKNMVVWCKDENELLFKFKRDILIDKISDRIVKNYQKECMTIQRGNFVFSGHCPLARFSKINLFIVLKTIVLLRINKLPYFKCKIYLKNG